MELLTRALFDAAAWIAVARLNYLQFTVRNADSVTVGTYGLHEVNPFWAKLPELIYDEESANAR